jgi:isopentenyl-diphosphate Delta-isomerase
MLPVSSESEELILVDRDDNVLGYDTKARVHDGDGILHRAFSIFLFNTHGELLLQQRSAKKRLWPLFWSNTCCSHPRRGEDLEAATQRRLREELGLTTPLEALFKFEYVARYESAGTEHELCSVFAGLTSVSPRVHPDEIAAVRWMPSASVASALATEPSRYTPWFKLEWERIVRDFPRLVGPR